MSVTLSDREKEVLAGVCRVNDRHGQHASQAEIHAFAAGTRAALTRTLASLARKNLVVRCPSGSWMTYWITADGRRHLAGSQPGAPREADQAGVTLGTRQRGVLAGLAKANDRPGNATQTTAFQVHALAGGTLRGVSNALAFLVKHKLAAREGAGTPTRYRITDAGRKALS